MYDILNYNEYENMKGFARASTFYWSQNGFQNSPDAMPFLKIPNGVIGWPSLTFEYIYENTNIFSFPFCMVKVLFLLYFLFLSFIGAENLYGEWKYSNIKQLK